VGFTATTEKTATSKQEHYGWDHDRQQATRTIVLDSPTRERLQVENHYVEVPTEEYRNAHAWAAEQLVRKQPGLTSAIHQLEGMIAQRLNA
jgi:hypothetical protein